MSKDLRNRILITIVLLLLVQIISYIPIPLINIKYAFQFFNQGESNLGFFKTPKQFSISALGILPYLSASILVMIIFYLFRFRKGAKENNYRLHLYTVILTIIIIILQGIGLASFYQSAALSSEATVLVKTSGFFFTLGVIVSLSGGTLIVVWIAHVISERGIGNGLILIIGLRLLNHWVPSGWLLLKRAHLNGGEKFFLLFMMVALLIFIIVAIALLLSTWNCELKLFNGKRSNRPFILKFPLLLVGIFPILFMPNLYFTYRLFKMQWFGHPSVKIVVDVIFIVSFAFIYILIAYQPKRLQQIKAIFFPDSLSNNHENDLAFDQKIIRIFIIYSFSMLLVWGIASILEVYATTRLKFNAFQTNIMMINLFVLIAIIIDVYSQIKTHREMQIFYSAPGEETEPLLCEECNEKVTSADDYCRACGANFIAEARCSHHPERAATYRCMVCSRPLCDECSILIKGSHRCADHQSVEIREGWTKVHVAATFVEAQLIEEFFRENNIVSKCLSNVMGSNYGAIKLWQLTPVMPFMVARWLGGGEIKIFVPATDYSRSLKLLNEHSRKEN